LYTIGFREVSGLNSFKNFSNLATGCEDIAYCLVGYFILSHPVYCIVSVEINNKNSPKRALSSSPDLDPDLG